MPTEARGNYLPEAPYLRETKTYLNCGDAFPIEGVLVATYLLNVEALPHCRCGVANKGCMV